MDIDTMDQKESSMLWTGSILKETRNRPGSDFKGLLACGLKTDVEVRKTNIIASVADPGPHQIER
jgi:hypothetical protein